MDTKSLIQEIENLRNSRVITYLTRDRQCPVNARIAVEALNFGKKTLEVYLIK